MIGLLTGWGLSERLAKLVAYIGVPLLILGMFYIMLDAYGDSRYDAGRTDENTAWHAAQDELIARAAVAEGTANAEAVTRQVEFAAAVEEEKEKVDEAIATGGSPFDVLFPAAE